jgi:hypothetical protein
MNEPPRAWTAREDLGELTLWYDWDPVAAMIASLRIYLFEHGAIPAWNFLICAGRPELGEPYSWGFTWPSLFAYALPPTTPSDFRFAPPARAVQGGLAAFRGADLRGGELRVAAALPGVLPGACASLAGLLAASLWLWRRPRH